jgi:hypothetical protein
MNSLCRCLMAFALGALAATTLAAEPTTTEKMSSYAHERKAEAVAEGKRLIAESDKKIAAYQAMRASFDKATSSANPSK